MISEREGSCHKKDPAEQGLDPGGWRDPRAGMRAAKEGEHFPCVSLLPVLALVSSGKY